MTATAAMLLDHKAAIEVEDNVGYPFASIQILKLLTKRGW
jgi:hypothetical protein